MVALPDSFTFVAGDGTSYTVGGATPTSTTTILDRFGFADDQDMAEFHWRFVVEASDSADLATKCSAMEAILRQRYGSLVVKFGSNVQYVFNPSTTTAVSGSTSSGWDSEPLLTKAPNWPHSSRARAYDYRVRYALPPNFTDAYGPSDGRRSADANYHTDPNELPVVTLRGVWTQVVGSLARPQYLSQIDAYANYRLTLIDPAAQWTITRREESDPQSLSTLTWLREFSQVTNGRRSTSRDPVIQSNGLRLVSVRGTYLNTYGVSPKSATQNYNTDATTWVNTTLAAITTLEGGPLVIGQGCEVISQSTPANATQQNQRLDFTWVIRELRVPQSTNTNFLDDPNITVDSITMVIRHNPLNDSPEPQPVQQTAGGNVAPQGASGPGTGATVDSGIPTPQTLAGGSTPAPPGGPTVSSTTGASGTPVVKPIDVFARYSATFKASVVNLQQYYEQFVRPQLEFEFSAALGTSVNLLPGDEASFDIQNCKVSAEIHGLSVPGALIALKYSQTVADDSGLHFDGVFNGQPYNFLVQPGLPDRTMLRRVVGVYKTGSGISMQKYASKAWTPGQTGWVLFRSSSPELETYVQGIPALGYGLVAFTRETLVEELRWVAANAGSGVSGSSPPSGAAGSNQTGASGNAGGVSNNAPSPPGGPTNTPAPQPDPGNGPLPANLSLDFIK